MSDIPAAFAFLHTKTVESFGTTSRVWFPATRKGTSYTVEVTCAAGPVGAKAAALIGALSIPADALIIHATAADLPFEPRPGDVFLYGATAATGKKYEVVTATKAEGNHAHYRIVSQRIW